LSRNFEESINTSVRSIKLVKGNKSAVFDVSVKHLFVFDEFIKMTEEKPLKNFTLLRCAELPELI